MVEVTVYTTTICPYCVLATRLLDKKAVPYRTVDVSGDPERRAWLHEVSGRRTVPQIFIGDRCVGGYTDLAALDRSGALDALLAGG